MMRFAVIGNPINHSLSPVIHQQFASQAGITLSYEKILSELPAFEQEVSDFFKQGGKGLNVTAPFKIRAFAMAGHKSERALKAGAANTLLQTAGYLYADNTDGVGLIRDLGRYLDLKHKQVLLLGAGGAARGIIAPILAAGVAKLSLWNRSEDNAQALIQDFKEVCLLQNEASFDLILYAGAKVANLQIPAFIWQNQPFCYDLSYQLQSATPFVAKAIQAGCEAVDGLGMLVEQAAEAFALWHGFKPETGPVLKQLRALV